MEEHMGHPFFPDDWGNKFKTMADKALLEYEQKMNEEKEKERQSVDDWIYATTFGDLYEVITREDGTLTVKKKYVISSN